MTEGTSSISGFLENKPAILKPEDIDRYKEAIEKSFGYMREYVGDASFRAIVRLSSKKEKLPRINIPVFHPWLREVYSTKGIFGHDPLPKRPSENYTGWTEGETSRQVFYYENGILLYEENGDYNPPFRSSSHASHVRTVWHFSGKDVTILGEKSMGEKRFSMFFVSEDIKDKAQPQE